MFINDKSKYPIGLDISDTSLKLVQFNKKGGKYFFQAINKVDIPKGVISNGNVIKENELEKIIKKAISDPLYGKFTSKSVVACLAERKTFIKLIKIDKTPNPIRDTIENEIEKNIPYSIKEIFYDWQIIEETKNHRMILIGAALKKYVDQYAEIMDKAGLTIEALEIEPMAVCRCLLKEEALNFKEESGNYILVDIGSTRTNLIFYSRNTIIFTVDLNVTADEIGLAIENALKEKQAAKFSKEKNKDLNNNINIEIAVKKSIGEIITRLRESIEYYNNNYFENGEISKIILCGGGANLYEIEKIIQDQVAIKTEKGNPFANIKDPNDELMQILKNTLKLEAGLKKKLRLLLTNQDNSLIYAVAVGLALRGVFLSNH
jgi:type IV pilus assembly protein PilM